MDIFKTALRIGNNEFAWKSKDIPQVAEVLKNQGNAIIGAEVWIKTSDEKIKELYWFDFQIHDKSESESWQDYVGSTYREFIKSFNEIKNNRRIEEEREAERGEVFFNVSYLSEIDYNNLLTALNL